MTSTEQAAAAPVAAVPLKPHRYPLWLIGFAVLVVGAVAYSAIRIPPYLNAFIALRRAEAAAATGHRTEAEADLRDVLRLVPSSKAARIEIAVLLFTDPAPAQQQRGLEYLEGITLDGPQWSRVSAALPENLRGAFQPVKK